MAIKKYHKSANIFNVTPAMRDASNWEVRIYYGSKYFMFFELPTEFRTALSAKAFLKSGGSYYAGEVVGFANFQDYTNGNLERNHRILDNDGSTPNFSIDFSSAEKVYLSIGIGSGIREDNKQTLIDEFFDNYDTMAVQGTIVPSAYEPYDPEVWHSVPYRKYGTETDAITTLPATVIGDGTPISSYTIKGNMEQSGTPTPSSPIYPSECGERTENLFDKNTYTEMRAWIKSDGEIQKGSLDWQVSDYIPIEANENYTILNVVGFSPAYCLYDSNKNYISGNTYANSQKIIFQAPTNAAFARFSVKYGSTGGSDPNIDVFMVTKGSIAPETYEPYGYKLPITLGSTTTNIYLGESQSTRKIKKLVLTGEENWVLNNNRLMYITKITEAISYESVLCTHYISAKSFMEVYNTTNSTAVTDQEIYINSGSTDIADFKSYLAAQYANGTPVTIWYIIREPETAVVNEPIRKIGDYADSVSGTNIATSGTAQQFDVETTLKPSEVDMTYHGWHEHGDTKFTT